MLTRLRSVVSRVASIYRRREFERRLSDEWRLHLDLLTAENVQRGMPQREARRQAIITLGGFEQAREECREMICFRWLSELSGDFQLAFRSLRQNAVFTATVVIVLGLGIGANNGVLTLIDAVVFRPLPAARPDQLVEIPSGVSLPDYKDILSADDALSGLAAYSGLPLFARTASEGLSGRPIPGFVASAPAVRQSHAYRAIPGLAGRTGRQEPAMAWSCREAPVRHSSQSGASQAGRCV